MKRAPVARPLFSKGWIRRRVWLGCKELVVVGSRHECTAHEGEVVLVRHGLILLQGVDQVGEGESQFATTSRTHSVAEKSVDLCERLAATLQIFHDPKIFLAESQLPLLVLLGKKGGQSRDLQEFFPENPHNAAHTFDPFQLISRNDRLVL